MTGLEFLPLTFVAACIALAAHMRARRAERRAVKWERAAHTQVK